MRKEAQTLLGCSVWGGVCCGSTRLPRSEIGMVFTGLPFLFRPLLVGILLISPFYKPNEVLV